MLTYASIPRRVQQLTTSVQTLLQAKLGRCPKCMRWSILGALASWSAYGVGASLWPDPGLLLVLGIPAVCFTLLMATHVIVYVIRVSVALRASERRVANRSAEATHRMSRRQLAWMACQAAVSFVLVAVFGRRPAVGQIPVCAGPHNTPNVGVLVSSGETEIIARRNLEIFIIQRCDNACLNFGCTTGDCRAVQGGLKNPGIKCHFDKKTGVFSCQAEVVQCVCGCSTCEGQNSLIPPFNVGIGVGDTRAAAQMAAATDAQGLCGQFCEHLLCPAPTRPRCVVNVFTPGGVTCSQDRKTGKFTCMQTITTCTCRCGT